MPGDPPKRQAAQAARSAALLASNRLLSMSLSNQLLAATAAQYLSSQAIRALTGHPQLLPRPAQTKPAAAATTTKPSMTSQQTKPTGTAAASTEPRASTAAPLAASTSAPRASSAAPPSTASTAAPRAPAASTTAPAPSPAAPRASTASPAADSPAAPHASTAAPRASTAAPPASTAAAPPASTAAPRASAAAPPAASPSQPSLSSQASDASLDLDSSQPTLPTQQSPPRNSQESDSTPNSAKKHAPAGYRSSNVLPPVEEWAKGAWACVAVEASDLHTPGTAFYLTKPKVTFGRGKAALHRISDSKTISRIHFTLSYDVEKDCISRERLIHLWYVGVMIYAPLYRIHRLFPDLMTRHGRHCAYRRH